MSNDSDRGPSPETPDTFWYRVYIAVVLSTVIVVAALWAFSQYFR